jgi:hypothetical protein
LWLRVPDAESLSEDLVGQAGDLEAIADLGAAGSAAQPTSGAESRIDEP